MTMNLRAFNKDKGLYFIPAYNLESGKGLVRTEPDNPLSFVAGDKSIHGARAGVVTEGVLSALIDHLTELNVGELRNRHTSVAITKLEEALFWLEKRKKDREKRKVSGTYNK